MASSPDLSRLPPRGPRDLGTLENTSQDRQLEKHLSFFRFFHNKWTQETLRCITDNVLKVMLHHKVILQKTAEKILLLLNWWSGRGFSLCRSGTAPNTGRHHVCYFLHALLCSGRRRRDRTNQNWSQWAGEVVAPKAGKDVLRHPSGDRPSLCLQEVEDGGLRVSKTLGGGIQHREDSSECGWGLRDLDGT
jgi:hypothetical protein